MLLPTGYSTSGARTHAHLCEATLLPPRPMLMDPCMLWDEGCVDPLDPRVLVPELSFFASGSHVSSLLLPLRDELVIDSPGTSPRTSYP